MNFKEGDRVVPVIDEGGYYKAPTLNKVYTFTRLNVVYPEKAYLCPHNDWCRCDDVLVEIKSLISEELYNSPLYQALK